MESTIHQRIQMLIDHFSTGNAAAFGRGCDMLPSVLASIVGGRQSKPSFEALEKILAGYIAVSAEWLVMGRGPMLRAPMELQQPLTTEGRLQAIEAEIAQIRSTL
jgi:hypothetical protein